MRTKIRAMVMDPIHANMVNLRPFEMSPGAFAGDIKKGKPYQLMRPTGKSESEKRMRFLADEDYRNPNAAVALEWHDRVVGYWRASLTVTLRLPIPMRKELIPVWNLSLRGEFAQGIIGDHAAAEEVEDYLLRSCRPRFKQRNIFFPRGVPGTYGAYSYEVNTLGTWDSFRGSEKLFKDGQMLWSAQFHGGSIVPIA